MKTQQERPNVISLIGDTILAISNLQQLNISFGFIEKILRLSSLMHYCGGMGETLA